MFDPGRRRGGEREEGGGGGGEGEGEGFLLLLAFSSNQLFLFVVLEKKKDLFPICNHPTRGMTGKSTEKIPLFPRLKVWQFSSTCSE